MLEQQTWVTLLGFAGFTVALAGPYFAIKRDFKAEFVNFDSKIDKLDTKVDKLDTKVDKLDTKIDGVRTDLTHQIANRHADLKTDIAKADARLTTLESRLYDIVMRLPAASTAATSSAS